MNKKPKWTDHPREDLRMIPTMIKKSWDIEFEPRDRKYGRITPDNVPHWPVDFKKDDKIVRTSYYKRPHWFIAIVGRQEERREYDTLKELLKKEGL